MPRIDAGFGRQAGVNPASITPERSRALEDLGRGIAAVGGALEERRQFNNQVNHIRERQADDLALAELQSNTTIELSKRLDAASAQYDGAEGGFGERVRTEFGKFADETIAKEPARRQREARLALTGVTQRLALAAYDIEDGRRSAFVLKEAGRQSETDANAVRLDPAFYETALENHERRKGALDPSLRADYEVQRGAIDFAYGQARIDQDPDGFLKELKAGGLKQVDADVHTRLVNAAQAESERRRRQAIADFKLARAETKAAVTQELKSIEMAIEAGLPVDPTRLASAAAAAAIDPALQAKVSVQANVLRAVDYIMKAPFADAEAELAAMRARIAASGDAGPEETATLVALQKATAAQRTRASQDFAAFAQSAAPDRIAPLDLDALDARALSARGAAIEAAADYYGAGADKAYFTDAERTALAAKFLTDPKGAVEAAAVISAAPQGRQMLSELAPKSPELAHLGGLLAADGEATFIDDASQGAALTREKGFKSAVTKAADTEARALFGTAFALFPQSAEAARRSARLAYEARAARSGRASDDFDTELFGRALQEAAGGVYDRRGSLRGGVQPYRTAQGHAGEVLLPGWVKNGDMNRIMHQIAPQDLGGAVTTADGVPLRTDVVRKAFPVAVGEGRYLLALGDPLSDPQWAQQDGENFVLDLNSIRDRLAPAPAVSATRNKGQGER